MLDEWNEWVALVSAIAVILFGTGGVVAWLRQRQDAKQGVRQENRQDTDSLNARAVAMLETQFNYLVQPLQKKVDDLETDVTRLNEEVKTHAALYKMAVKHIKVLYTWIARHMPNELDQTEIPAPPVELAADL